jgi:hypothetical protein
MWIRLRCVLAGAIAFVLAQSALHSASQTPTEDASSALSRFLKQYLLRAAPESEISVAIGSVDLNGDNRQEQVVYVRGESWCGTGGCLVLVLRRTKTSYQVIGRITVAPLPIRVLESSNNGWRSIGVWIPGGGTGNGSEAILPFNGKRYPGNPTIPPARRSIGASLTGVVLLSDRSSFYTLD